MGDGTVGAHQPHGPFFERYSPAYRDILAGCALASPFLADLVSWKVAGALFLPWLIHTLIARPVVRNRKVSLLAICLSAIIVIHVGALLFSVTPYWSHVVKEALIAAALLSVMATVDKSGKAAIGFFSIVSTFGAATAALGLLKLGLQDRGYLLQVIIDQCPQQYPQGSSLCGDYNLTGMMWLVAATGAIALHVNTRRIWPLLVTILILAAGALAGSRRFLLLAPLLPLFWIGIELSMRFTIKNFAAACAKILAVGISTFVLVQAVSAPEEFERFRFGAEKYTTLQLSDLWGGVPNDRTAPDIRSPNRAYPGVIAGTIKESDAEIGDEPPPASRIDRWLLTADLIKESPIVGTGFAYHEIFSCKFVDCKFIDYPHLSIGSEWLIAGVIGAFFAVSFYCSIVIRIAKLRTYGFMFGASMAAIFTIPYSLISGDTILSMPHIIAASVLIHCLPLARDSHPS